MVLQTGDRQHRLVVELGVVNAVEQMDSARSGGRDADAELARPFGVAARREGGDFLVPHLDEANFVLALAQRFEDSVDAVAGQSEDHLDAPVDQRLNEDVAGGLGHGFLLPCPPP